MTVTVPQPTLVLGALVTVAVIVMLVVAYRLGRLLVTELKHDPVMVVIMESIGGIGLVGWVQSFVSLRTLAFTASLPEWEADSSPALLDTFALAMGLAALRARHLRGKGDLHADILAIGYSLVAVVGNLATAVVVLHEAHQTDPFIIVVTLAYRMFPPLTMLVGFHWLMGNVSPKPAAPTVVVTRVEQIEQALMVAVRAGLVALHADVVPLLPALTTPEIRRVDEAEIRHGDDLLGCRVDEPGDEPRDDRRLVTVTNDVTSRVTNDEADDDRQGGDPDDESGDEPRLVRMTPQPRQGDDQPVVVALRKTTITTTELPPASDDPRIRKMGRALLAEPRLSNEALGKKVGCSEPTARRNRAAAEQEALRLRMLREAREPQEAEA